MVKYKMNAQVIRHTNLRGKSVKNVAICGGSGSFLLKQAIAAGADAFASAFVGASLSTHLLQKLSVY